MGVNPIVGWTPVLLSLPAGKSIASVLPFSPLKNDPAPFGRYRVCFRYFTDFPEKKQKVCSGAFWLS
jgi:hypothetical protein